MDTTHTTRGGRRRKAQRVGAVMLAAVTAAVGASFTTSSSAATLIQPGEFVAFGDSGCTLSFVYDAGGSVYIGTAAHCVDKVGDDAELADGTVFGDVAAIGDEDATETDWALIKVRTAHVNAVSAAMKGHPAYPTGVTKHSDTTIGDVVQQSGYGVGFNLTATTREQRQSMLTYDDARIFAVLGASIYGDSGGPIVHIRTGKALGIVSRLCVGVPPCEMEGPTVEGIISQARSKGLEITLRTVSSTSTTSTTSTSSTTSSTTTTVKNGKGGGGGGGKPSR